LGAVSAGTVLLDASGKLRLQGIPELSTSQGIVSIVSSPGTSSPLASADDDSVLQLQSENPPCLICRGATKLGTSVAERDSLATTSLVAGSIVVDGITEGDVEGGILNSRHARTVTLLFRARIALHEEPLQQQTLILCLHGDSSEASKAIIDDLQTLYKAVAVEKKDAPAFEDLYQLQIVSLSTSEDANKVRRCERLWKVSC